MSDIVCFKGLNHLPSIRREFDIFYWLFEIEMMQNYPATSVHH